VDALAPARLKIKMPGMSFQPTVTVARPDQELRWSARILTPRFFLGEHAFRLEPGARGGTTLTNTEIFSGVSVRPFRRLFGHSDRDNGYDLFNRALKRRVEGTL
jgi:hypothetical protein